MLVLTAHVCLMFECLLLQVDLRTVWMTLVYLTLEQARWPQVCASTPIPPLLHRSAYVCGFQHRCSCICATCAHEALRRNELHCMLSVHAMHNIFMRHYIVSLAMAQAVPRSTQIGAPFRDEFSTFVDNIMRAHSQGYDLKVNCYRITPPHRSQQLNILHTSCTSTRKAACAYRMHDQIVTHTTSSLNYAHAI
jgi:hypothetical protein